MLGRACCCGCAPLAANTLFSDDFNTSATYNASDPGSPPQCWYITFGSGFQASGGILTPVVNTAANLRRRIAAVGTCNGLIVDVQITVVGIRTESSLIVQKSDGTKYAIVTLKSSGGINLICPSGTSSASSAITAGDVLSFSITDTSSGGGTFDVEVFVNGVSKILKSSENLGTAMFLSDFLFVLTNDSTGSGTPQYDDFSLLVTV